jgi:oligoribonuclease NrnB/cAMP/cGMP phosphodiesterase (DHH superfamily)
MWKPDICVYHMPCDDGFASAWIVHGKWPDCALAPTNYGLAFPDVDIVGKKLLIADFSYKPDVLADLLKRGAHSIVVLDHHKTAEADLAQFKVGQSGLDLAHLDGMFRDMIRQQRPPILARFELERSGASLTWEFCYPVLPLPKLIAHIEDRDLWRMALPDTRKIILLLRSYPYNFLQWEDLINTFDLPVEKNELGQVHYFLDQAAAIERFYDCKIAEMAPTATLRSIAKWDGVPIAHAPYAFASDLGHELLKAYPDAPFAAVVVDAYGGRTYSLRSEDSRQDVSEVAKLFGGGGHRNAAGFRVPA